MLKRIKEYLRKPKIGDIWVIRKEFLSGSNPFNEVNTYRYTVVDILKGWVRIRATGSSFCSEHPISEFKSIFKREV